MLINVQLFIMENVKTFLHIAFSDKLVRILTDTKTERERKRRTEAERKNKVRNSNLFQIS